MDNSMRFETTMRHFFGDAAYQIASQATNPKDRSEWIRKVVKRLMKIVNDLDTTVGHKKILMAILERILNEVSKLLNTRPENVGHAVEILFETWKKKRKEIKNSSNST